METIIVSGATGNLGQAVVAELASAGYHLVLPVSPGSRTDIYPEYQVSVYELDLLDEEATRRFVERAVSDHGTIRAAVMLVGGFAAGTIRKSDRASLEKMIQLNFFTAYHLTRPLLDHFAGLEGPRQLIYTGSRPGLDPQEGKSFFAYSLSKSLLFRMAEMVNAENKGKQVTASVIVPATMDTPANRAAMPDARFSDWVPTERVAAVIAFLLSEAGEMMREPVLKIYNNS